MAELNTTITDDEYAVNSDHLQKLESEYVEINSRIELISKKWEDVNDAIDGTLAAVNSGKITSKTELALVQAGFSNALKDVPTEEEYAALESHDATDIEQIALEVFKRAKDSVVKLIQWFVDQFKAIKKAVVEFFKTHFSQMGRLQKRITAQQDQLKERGDGNYEISENKVKVSNWANAVQLDGKIVSQSSLVQGLGSYKEIGDAYLSAVYSGMDKCVSEFDGAFKKVKVEEGKEVDLSGMVTSNLDKQKKLIDQHFGKLVNVKVAQNDYRFSSVDVKQYHKEGLLGNVNLFRTNPKKTPETHAERNRAILEHDIRLLKLKPNMGDAKNDGEVDTLTFDQCSEVLSMADETLNVLAGLGQGADFDKANKNLDSAFESFDKLKGQLRTKDFTPDLRAYLQFIGNQLTAFRRQLLDTPRSILVAGTASVNAAVYWTGRSINNHKKSA